MAVTERQKLILDTVIEEYINSAQPISSQLLERKYDFGICPATIRIEMHKLTDLGFLRQPHTSAGRIPTDEGYRFFVNDLLEERFLRSKDVFEIESILKKEREDIFRFVAQISKFLAMASSNLIIIHLPEKDFFWKEGWEELLREPEFEEKDFVFAFTRFLDKFEKNIKDLKVNSEIKIYIGRENPVSEVKDFSIISSRYHFPDREQAVLSFLGPKRMDYDKNIRLINSLTKILEKL